MRRNPGWITGASIAFVLALADAALAKERLLVLNGIPGTGFQRIESIDPYQPFDPGSTLPLETLGVVFSMPAYFTYADTLSIDPATGRLFTIVRYVTQFGTIASMVEIDRETGETTDLGGPSTYTGKYAFDPVTHAFHSVNGVANWRYTAPGGSGTILPSLAFASDDPHAGVTPTIAGFEFTPLAPGVKTSTCFALDSNLDALCRIDFTSGVVTTVGPLGIDLPSTLSGPVIDVDRTMFFVADLGAGGHRYSVDLATGAATDEGTFPTFHGISDMVLIPDLSGDHDTDDDAFPDVIEIAAGSHPGNEDSRPFVDTPVVNEPPTLVKSLKVALDFAEDSEDSFTLKGSLPWSELIVVEGLSLVVEVGNDAHAFTLDSKGKGTSASGAKFKLAKKPKKGALAFELKRKQADLRTLFEESGLVNADVTGGEVTLHVSVWIEGACFEADPVLTYEATAGDGGKAK